MGIRVICGIAAAIIASPLGAVAQAWEEPQVATVLEFVDASTLIVAEAATDTLYAFTLEGIATEAPNTESSVYNVKGVDDRLADAVGVPARQLSFNDLAVHPVTHAAYISWQAVTNDGEVSGIATVDKNGRVTPLPLGDMKSVRTPLVKTADDDVTFWRDVPATSLSVTDIDYHDGALYVSGLGTGEFASTLRVVPFPFSTESSSTSIEMFHAAHGQMETRAPIRAMTIMDVAGTPTVVAAYTCTPLVTVPVEALEDGKHVIGKTIAELGFGNVPLEVIDFTAYTMERKPERFVLVINRDYSGDLIAMDDLVAATEDEGLTKPMPYLGATLGVKTTSLPLGGVLQGADQDGQFLLTLRRDAETGGVDLLSFRKGSYFRLSDFVSEYNFPDYAYGDDEASKFIRQFQNMLKVDEGFPELVR